MTGDFLEITSDVRRFFVLVSELSVLLLRALVVLARGLAALACLGEDFDVLAFSGDFVTSLDTSASVATLVNLVPLVGFGSGIANVDSDLKKMLHNIVVILGAILTLVNRQ